MTRSSGHLFAAVAALTGLAAIAGTPSTDLKVSDGTLKPANGGNGQAIPTVTGSGFTMYVVYTRPSSVTFPSMYLYNNDSGTQILGMGPAASGNGNTDASTSGATVTLTGLNNISAGQKRVWAVSIGPSGKLSGRRAGAAEVTATASLGSTAADLLFGDNDTSYDRLLIYNAEHSNSVSQQIFSHLATEYNLV